MTAQRVCFCGTSALELYRSNGRLLPDVLACSRTARLSSCGIPLLPFVKDAADTTGVGDAPYHVLVASDIASHTRKHIVRHIISAPLPTRSLVVVRKDVWVVGPELLFCTLAAEKRYDEVDLALIGFELCGTYLIEDDMWDGFINTAEPVTSVEKLARAVSTLGRFRGVCKARRALSLIQDGSHSPMESVMTLLLASSRRVGSVGFPRGSLNMRVMTADGPRFVDLGWPTLGAGLEYKGRAAHALEKTKRDDRRQNKLAGSKMTIINVWYEDLSDPILFKALVRDIAHVLGVRIRIRDKGFSTRHSLLRMKLLPHLKTYGARD